VRQGDIVVAATDGLFDNVYPDEAASLVAASKVGGVAGWRVMLSFGLPAGLYVNGGLATLKSGLRPGNHQCCCW
jgi:hypothetical protein